MRIAYADPPYPGQSKLYTDHQDYAGEVDHYELAQLLADYDGWCLHTSMVALHYVQTQLDRAGFEGPDPFVRGSGEYRIMAWVKPFAAYKANVSVAYSWEPVLVKPCRKPVVKPGMAYRDYIAAKITLERGLTGAKPAVVCRWLFEVMGCEPDDELVDLFPGTGAVTYAWDHWRTERPLFDLLAAGSEGEDG